MPSISALAKLMTFQSHNMAGLVDEISGVILGASTRHLEIPCLEGMQLLEIEHRLSEMSRDCLCGSPPLPSVDTHVDTHERVGRIARVRVL
jgi:hypothetical protein